MQVCDVARILVDWRGTFVCSTEYLAAIRFKWSKVGFVRKADIGAECSKGLLPTVSTSGGVAASYGSGYALEVMREHMDRVW